MKGTRGNNMDRLDLNSADIPRPEYPRPQFVRDTWMNLNGQWDFLFDFGNSGMDRRLWQDDELDKAMRSSATQTGLCCIANLKRHSLLILTNMRREQKSLEDWYSTFCLDLRMTIDLSRIPMNT